MLLRNTSIPLTPTKHKYIYILFPLRDVYFSLISEVLHWGIDDCQPWTLKNLGTVLGIHILVYGDPLLSVTSEVNKA